MEFHALLTPQPSFKVGISIQTQILVTTIQFAQNEICTLVSWNFDGMLNSAVFSHHCHFWYNSMSPGARIKNKTGPKRIKRATLYTVYWPVLAFCNFISEQISKDSYKITTHFTNCKIKVCVFLYPWTAFYKFCQNLTYQS